MYKMTLCLVSVFKNESAILREWLVHYINQGVDHFFLTDNGSTDNYMEILKEYIEKGIVTLTINPMKYAQVYLINLFLDKIKQYEWVMGVDLDEIVYARLGFQTIKHYLSSIDESVHCVRIPWKMFGSDGHISQPSSVISSFLRRQRYDKPKEIQVKSIARTLFLTKIEVHFPYFSDSSLNLIDSTGTNDNYIKDYISLISEDILEKSALHLNHYYIQSWEWYKSVKMTRGDVNLSYGENVRNAEWFKTHDFNECVDDEIAKLI